MPPGRAARGLRHRPRFGGAWLRECVLCSAAAPRAADPVATNGKTAIDVADVVRRFNAGRDPERLQRKYAAMRASPFAFLRGSCQLFYARMARGGVHKTAPSVWACGDLHFENFGSYEGDNGLAYFDIVDFDESALAPATWDLVRLLASVQVGAAMLQVGSAGAQRLCRTFVEAYADALALGKAYWVERDTATGLGARPARRPAPPRSRRVHRCAHEPQGQEAPAEPRRQEGARRRCRPATARGRLHARLCEDAARSVVLRSARCGAPHRRHRQPRGRALRDPGARQGRARSPPPARPEGERRVVADTAAEGGAAGLRVARRAHRGAAAASAGRADGFSARGAVREYRRQQGRAGGAAWARAERRPGRARSRRRRHDCARHAARDTRAGARVGAVAQRRAGRFGERRCPDRVRPRQGVAGTAARNGTRVRGRRAMPMRRPTTRPSTPVSSPPDPAGRRRRPARAARPPRATRAAARAPRRCRRRRSRPRATPPRAP